MSAAAPALNMNEEKQGVWIKSTSEKCDTEKAANKFLEAILNLDESEQNEAIEIAVRKILGTRTREAEEFEKQAAGTRKSLHDLRNSLALIYQK